ncbi:hypothetical protein, conserved [Eimeria tenella]|uniref:Uncharacterized protein n=1 Tax=Eimeria tenella TaxID=5802 RepID=U6KNY5_EIMTE|nr:hypothetical protein, conserved [Eimeria tenella]CDJ38531.1 hypothetical protein, conserved [Eimeria tenella]|eukprot:XP_013229369.1 hypothetical protein, conserved [Eimeria tenella]
MLGALQSSMPSFMCACLVLMYHRERVRLFGLPRETAKALGGFYSIASALGCLVYLALLMATVFVFQVDRTEEPAYFFLSSTWLLVTLLWFILQACLKPPPKRVEELVQQYEAARPGANAAAAAAAAAAAVAVGAPLVAVGAPLAGPPEVPETEMARAARSQPVVIGQVRT